MMVHVEAFVERQRGPTIKESALLLTGNVNLFGLKADVVFRGQPGQRHLGHEESRAIADIIPTGCVVPIPFQRIPLDGRGEADLWVSVSDLSRQPPWTEHYVGRCTGQTLTFDRALPVRAILDARFTPEPSQGDGATTLEVAGEIRFEYGITARLMRCEPGRPPSPPRDGKAFEAVLLTVGTTLAICRQTVTGFAGSDPWISVSVLEAPGRVVQDEQLLGRCVQVH